ncbi:unnamed protein product [Mytilus coruscus]|uniref:Uncharacterized protein n=1 Tax=Mytilus coruscus TaxID=42192 RepID=A0A6J8DHF9_MYTCO|nr:unnamed protein product [Mytilus coruscus]
MTARNNSVCETQSQREEYTPEDRPISTETTRQLTEFLEASMPDFSDLLGVEPCTPPLMRQLLNEEPPPEVLIPSDQLFSKYLQDLSPVNSPDHFSIDIDLEPQEPSVSSITLHNPEPSPLVSIANNIDHQQPSPSVSIATSINHHAPTEQILDLTITRTITPCTPILEITSSNTQEYSNTEEPITTNQEYETHLLASTLKEKVNLCRSSQQAKYQRQLVPIGVRTIMKEDRCYLPDGTILEMKEVWTSDQPTPSPTEE